jgi:hypothetical protein
MPTVEFTHNQKTHSTTRQSLFFLMMGYEPQAIPTAYPKTNVPSVEQRVLNLQKAREEAIAAHDLARQKMAERTTRGFTPFKKGNKVWLEGTNLWIRYQSRKFAPKREGPFEIQDVLGPVTYRLNYCTSGRSIRYSTLHSSPLIKKTILTDQTSLNHLLTLLIKKCNTKWTALSITKAEAEASNTSWNGKVTHPHTTCGNLKTT